MANATGLSLYFPTKSQYDTKRDQYAQLTMSQIGHWDEFLQGLFYPNVPWSASRKSASRARPGRSTRVRPSS